MTTLSIQKILIQINIIIYHIGYMTIKDVSYVKFNSVNPLYLINKINGYIEERNGNKHLTSAPTDESKQTLKNIKNYGEKS